MLRTQTRGGRMEGADKSTELWRHPILNKCCYCMNCEITIHRSAPKKLFLFPPFSDHRADDDTDWPPPPPPQPQQIINIPVQSFWLLKALGRGKRKLYDIVILCVWKKGETRRVWVCVCVCERERERERERRGEGGIEREDSEWKSRW